jgi:hypothetical protein
MSGDGGHLSRETSDAIAALAHRIHKRDEAAEEDRADPIPFATEYVMALKLRGWRPTELRAVPAWTMSAGRRGADPKRHAHELAGVRAACEQALAKLKAADREAQP